jgi:hypothetical protein
MSQQQSIEERKQAQAEQQARQIGQQAATSASQRKLEEKIENPEFFQQLRDADLSAGDDSEFAWIEDELGPATSGAHIIGNRGPEYERQVEWLNRNRAERVISESEPGRLCSGSTLRVAQRVHGRPDKDVKPERTMDEKRGVRDAFDALTNLRSLAVGAQGLKSVTQATAVSKVEKSESKESSLRERAARVIG